MRNPAHSISKKPPAPPAVNQAADRWQQRFNRVIITGRSWLREPDLQTLLRICTALDATPNDLLVPDSPSRRLSAHERWLTRLVAAARDLDADDVKLAARQIEALAEHRNPGRGR